MKRIPHFLCVFSFIFVLFIVSSCGSLSDAQQQFQNNTHNIQCNFQSSVHGSPSCATSTPSSIPSSCHYVYSKVVHIYPEYIKVFDTEVDKNPSTTATETAVLTTTKNGTFNIQIEAGIQIETPLFGDIINGLVHLNIQASHTVSTGVDNQISYQVPPSEEVVGKYGVFIQKASVYLSATNCAKKDVRIITVDAPLYSGWCPWIRSIVPSTNQDQDPCPEI